MLTLLKQLFCRHEWRNILIILYIVLSSLFFGFLIGCGFCIWRIEIAKDNFWRCQPEIHGTGYCFYNYFGK